MATGRDIRKFCGLALLLSCFLPATLLDAATEEEEKSRLEAVRKRIETLQRQMKETRGKKSRLAELLEQTELAEAALRNNIAAREQEIARLQRELAQLEKQRDAIRLDLRKQSAQIAMEVAAAHRLGRQEPLKLLLNQEDPETLSRTLKYYDYFLEARGEKLAHYRKTVDKLTAVELRARERIDLVAAEREKLREQHARLREEQTARRKVVAELDKSLGSDSARLEKLNRERSQLEQILLALKQAIQNLHTPADEPFKSRKGQLLWPARGRISHGFGAIRAANLRWQGWLFDTREGSEINAIHYGRVVFSDYLRGQGLLLIIDHGDGYLSLYAHNQVLLKETGEWVSSGEPIARAGMSGGLESSALYFEIRHNGRPLDPKVWLAPRR